MNEELATLGLVKIAIFDLPVSDQEKVRSCAAVIRSAVEEAGAHGSMALALVGAEAAASAA